MGKLFVQAAVEGVADAAVTKRIVGHVGGQVSKIHVKKGKSNLRKNIRGYNNAARREPWLVLVDLDTEEDCPAVLRDKWLLEPAPYLCFRIAVREVESWLLADAESLARYLDVPQARVPRNPEGRADPKGDMVALARRSRRKEVREGMAPAPGSGSNRQVGPAYSLQIGEYVDTAWRPGVAARHADSLRRAIACLRRLVAGRRAAAA